MNPNSRTSVIEELGELIEIPLIHPDLYGKLGIPPPRAILLYGVTGSGKTHLIKKVAKRANARFVPINLSSVTGDVLLNQIEKETRLGKPIVFYLVMHNPEGINKEVLSTLGKLLDGETDIDLDKVIVTGSSVRPTLPSELTRPGRFDKELHVPLPNTKERYKIFKEITIASNFSEEIDFMGLAKQTRGFTPADLIQTVKTAARFAIRRELPEHKLYDNNKDLNIPSIKISKSDLESAISSIQPTVYKEFGLIQPEIDWEDIAGQYEIKSIIEDAVIKPIKFKDYYQKAGVSSINGILLYGPPGNGKTTLAKAIASSINGHFLYINSSEIIDKGGKRMAQLFDIANQVEPTILFFDEIDSLIPNRKSGTAESIILVNEFLKNMDKLESTRETLVIAATNYLDNIDNAALRPGRLELKIFVPPPDKISRLEAFDKLTSNINRSEDLDFKVLAELTKENELGVFSFADLVAIVREAGVEAAQDYINDDLKPSEVTLKQTHFEKVINQFKPSLNNFDITE